MRPAALRPRFSLREHSMFSTMRWSVILGAVLASTAMSVAQTQVQRETLSVQGFQGQTTIIRTHGRMLVDVQDLARITKGSLSFEEGRMTLALAPSEAGGQAHDA